MKDLNPLDLFPEGAVNPGVWHVLPVGDRVSHDSWSAPDPETDTQRCPCAPVVLQVCPEGLDGDCDASCYRCEGEGMVQGIWNEDMAVLVVHNA